MTTPEPTPWPIYGLFRASGGCMAPLIEDGDLLVIDTAVVPQPGDLVIVLPMPGKTSPVYVKRLVELGDEIVRLEQDHPPKRLVGRRNELSAVLKVIGEARTIVRDGG